ncbi:MAG: hypothetical protein ACR2IK_05710 [Chloroflexota bacterium]
MQQLTLPDGHPWEPPLPTDSLALAVLEILQDGRVHDRHVLADQVDATVRQVRAAISELRRQGWPICFGGQGGYLLSWDAEDLEQLLRKYRSQALAELRVINRLKRAMQRRAA